MSNEALRFVGLRGKVASRDEGLRREAKQAVRTLARSVGPMNRAERAVLSLVVLVHGLASVGSVFGDTAFGKPIRAVTVPWEKTFGVHQTWPMFGSPPRSTTTLRFVALTAEGSEHEVPVLPGEPDPDGVLWAYDRGTKLERNAAEKKRDYLRASLVRYVCRVDPTAVRVRVERVSRRSPPPFVLPVAPRSEWPVEVERLNEWNCRRDP